MSGGFFRGTTADQDTRFSNKQAKLMKSQKFAPELEHLVDMTKVKIDVVKPWIAKRVTELLGFEDEVLINFIYGLLDGKNVNGKEIQISITGFMEKNTGKFMKELWTLLLSAQKNASGVPQQFLDEKEEETKKKKADAERITNEIQRKKEREAEESGLNQKNVEGGPDTSRTNATDDKLLTNRNGRDPSDSPDERKEIVGRKARLSRSSHSTESSLSPSRRRSNSRSPKAHKRSISAERERPNQRRSVSPRYNRSSRRSPSLSRRRSSYRRRSRSRSRSRSISPQRFRSFHHTSPHARRRRSPSPVRRRSPSPVRRRSPSPVRRRSPVPVRRRSQPRRSRRSPSPVRRRSPLRRSRSPVRRSSRALIRRQSHSPGQGRSPLLPQRRGSTSSPSQGAYPSPKRSSPSPSSHRLSSSRRRRTPPMTHERSNQKSPSAYGYRRQSPDSRNLLASAGGKQHSPSDVRPFSPDQSASESPIRQLSTSPYRDSPTHMKKPILPSSAENHSSLKNRLGHESVDPNNAAPPKEIYLVKTSLSSESPAERHRETLCERGSNAKDIDHEKGALLSEQNKLEVGGHHLKAENASQKLMGRGASGASSDSGYEDGKKRKHKGSSSKYGVTSDDDSSDADGTKDVKRRKKKEDKRMRREKRRQRHEEKRRRKEERRSERHKSRKDDDSYIEKKIHDKSDFEEEEEEKKKQLEIELRKKALESLKAKKGIGQ